MKKIFKILWLFSFLGFFISSCSNEQPTPVKNSALESSTDVNSLQKTLAQNNLSVSPDKLFYQAGNTINFSGTFTDSKGNGISGAQIGIDDPVRLVCALGPKTDKGGKFAYSVGLPSTAKGIYAFAFYCGTSQSYSALTVTPSGGLKLANNSYKIPLGVSPSISSFDLSSSIKISSSSGFPIASQDQLRNTANEIGSFMVDAGWNSLVDYVSNPATDFVTLAAIGCTATTVWTGAGVVACTPLYDFVAEEAGKSIIVGTFKAVIDKTSMSSADKLSWKNSIDEESCYVGIVGLGPASSALDVVDAFGTGWTCGSAVASETTDSKNNTSLKIIASPSSGSSKQNVGAFVLLRNSPPNKPSNPNPANGATNISTSPKASWSCSDPDGNALLYDVYAGTNASAPKVASNVIVTSYQLSGLSRNLKYYWKIVAKDNYGGVTSGDWWSFTTKPNSPPNKPSNPNPGNGATSVSTSPKVSWSCSDPDGDALLYDVYAGTNTSASKIASNVSATSYQLSGLSRNTKYYWKIVAKDNYGGVTSGDWWSFTTLK